MKNWFLILLTTLTLVACGQNPKSLVESYYTNLDNGEISEAYSLMSQQLIGKAGEQKLRAILQREAKNMQAKGGIATMDIDGSAKGEIGEFNVHIVFKDGSKLDKTVSVVKEDGWKISPQ